MANQLACHSQWPQYQIDPSHSLAWCQYQMNDLSCRLSQQITTRSDLTNRIAQTTQPSTAAFIEGIHWLAEQFVRSAVTSIASSGHPYHVSRGSTLTWKLKIRKDNRSTGGACDSSKISKVWMALMHTATASPLEFFVKELQVGAKC